MEYEHIPMNKAMPYPLGFHKTETGYRVSFVSRGKDCGVIIYLPGSGKELRIPFGGEYRNGSVYAAHLTVQFPKDFSYLFYEDGDTFMDPYTMAADCRRGWMKTTAEKCRPMDFYDWKDDTRPFIPYREKILYMLHVRGYTMHKSSGVEERGTFAGLLKKLPYMKELGITSIILMPAYDFMERMEETDINHHTPEQYMMYYTYGMPSAAHGAHRPKTNYWGYAQKNRYFLPKGSFSASEQAGEEYKDFVKAVHKNGMEVFMQIYFPDQVTVSEMLSVLTFWKSAYHIDGFHLIGAEIPVKELQREPILADCYLLFEHVDRGMLEGNPYSASVSDAFMYDMRCFLKGDGDNILSITQHVRRQFPTAGDIHFLAKQDTMRFMDMVSYQEKHNQDNGENNTDGTDYNCSWNCGIEGKTRKKQILLLRMKQLKNAMVLLLLSQGTPLLYGGDEFGHTQSGNNNPYCQDNAVNHINWTLLEKNEELYTFTKRLMALRRQYPILQGKVEFKGTDYLSCGYPDISFHAEEAWRTVLAGGSHLFGVMYCNRYAGGDENSLLYVAYNMHWESHSFALPKIQNGMKWECILTSAGGAVLVEDDRFAVIPERSTAVFLAK